MKRYLFLLVAVVFLLGLMSFASAETTVAYEDLPQAHRTLYETAMAKALAEAPRRVPAKSNLRAMPRGDFNGYTDQKSDNSLQVEYRVSDSVVKVGEKIKFYVNMNCDYPPMIYTVTSWSSAGISPPSILVPQAVQVKEPLPASVQVGAFSVSTLLGS